MRVNTFFEMLLQKDEAMVSALIKIAHNRVCNFFHEACVTLFICIVAFLRYLTMSVALTMRFSSPRSVPRKRVYVPGVSARVEEYDQRPFFMSRIADSSPTPLLSLTTICADVTLLPLPETVGYGVVAVNVGLSNASV